VLLLCGIRGSRGQGESCRGREPLFGFRAASFFAEARNYPFPFLTLSAARLVRVLLQVASPHHRRPSPALGMESYISPAFAKGKPAVPRPLPGMASGAGATPMSPGSGELSLLCAGGLLGAIKLEHAPISPALRPCDTAAAAAAGAGVAAVTEAVSSVSISGPINVQRMVHVEFDNKTGTFTGMPSVWKSALPEGECARLRWAACNGRWFCEHPATGCSVPQLP
jgi:hypothetical protein